MFDDIRPVNECYEFKINFNKKNIHVFITHHIDEDNFHASTTEIYYLDEFNTKRTFEADEELILKEALYFNGFDKI